LKTLLLISHSSNKTGGGEDDFQKLLMHFYGKYHIYSIFPNGDRSNIFKKYSDKYCETEGTVFPFTKFKVKEYFNFFRRNVKKLFQVYSFIKKNNNVDLCFLNSSVCFMEAIPVVLLKIPYILSVKEKINPYIIRKIIYKFYDITSLKIITISKYLKKEIENVTNKKDIEIIYSTVNENYFDKSLSQDIKNKNNSLTNFKILNIGSIYPLKGQHILAKAMLRLQKSNINAEFIGEVIDYKYYSHISEIKNSISNKDVIKFTKGLNKIDLINKILESDIVVITSEEEGQSLIILEALYLEKPIITTKVGIANEIIKNNVNGLLYEYGDVNKLCDLILKLKNDRQLYDLLVSNCKSTYTKNFNSEKMMKRYENVFSESLIK
jgi:glycosyltransferase involved in cell wall biosynthesis